MITCPKCQVPNPDTSTACAACGTTLVGQQFAQALDQAMGAPTGGAPPPMKPALPPGAPPLSGGPSAVAPLAPPPVGGGIAPLQLGMDPSQAQAEINQFIAEQRARKRTKSFIYFAVAVVVAGVIGFFVWSSSQKETKKREVAEFYNTFNKVDDDSVGAFWKCTVRAKDMDVHKSTDVTIITRGLEDAFRNFPKGQPPWLRDKCIPMITAALDDLGKLKPPSGFADPLESVKASLKGVKTAFETYASTIDKRKQEAADEQEIREASADFHQLPEKKDAPKALAYFNILNCAIPELAKKAKAITKPPDTQPVAEYIYENCVKKGVDPKPFAATLHKCFGTRNENQKKTPDFFLVAHRMAGEAEQRDLSAINDCLRMATHGFAFDELKAVGEAYVKYFQAREEMKKPLKKIQEELRGH
jgi:hypothetical protein